MKKSFRLIGFVSICWATLLSSAMALPTALELGSVDPGSPAAPTTETGYISMVVKGYNAGLTGTLSTAFTGDSGHVYVVAPAAGVPAAPLPAVGTNNGQVAATSGPQTGLQVNLGLGGYNYILVKWGNEDEFYYIGGMTGTIVVNNDVDGNGESHYDLFGTATTITPPVTVPDNGATITLLGLALIGLVVVARMVRSGIVRS